MSYPTLRPEYWEQQRQEQRAAESRIGRTGGIEGPVYCTTQRFRYLALILLSGCLTSALIDIDGESLVLILLVGTPFAIVIVGWLLKLYCKSPTSTAY
jgi:hypothetical protein